MKEITILLLCLIFFLSLVDSAHACSGFAVYSNKTFYGMNLDFQPTELQFVFHNEPGGQKFFAQFLKIDGIWRYSNGMNVHGMFTNYQMVYGKNYKNTSKDPTVQFYQVVESLGHVQNFNDVEKIFQGKRIIPNPGFALHSLVASKDGQAMIIELLSKGNRVMKNEENFIVMTNFYNSDYIGTPYNKVNALEGGDRYQSMYKGIKNNMGQFEVSTCFELLKNTQQYHSISSIVYDPEELVVYIVLDRQFERIFKVSFEDETIATFSGFLEEKVVKLGPDGIMASELQTWR